MVHFSVTQKAEHASADHIWDKLAQYSDMTWHPSVVACKDIGSVPDGSPDMVGARRLLTNEAGTKLDETIRVWKPKEKYMSLSIDDGLPPFAESLDLAFAVHEKDGEVFVEMSGDMVPKPFLACLSPVFGKVLPKKLGGFLEGISGLKEE